MQNKNLYAVIMAGGKGTRFWPLSREMFPKQYLKLIGENTLIQETILRVKGSVDPERIHIITTSSQKSIVDWQAGEVLEKANSVCEPVGKNTAPAIAYMAFKLHKLDPDAVLLVLPSDHHISDPGGFLKCVELASGAADKGGIVTFGIKPTRPETGYGYIKAGPEKSAGIKEVERFVEKPDRETAEKYLKQGGYYWNSGMFVFKAATMLDELKAYMPATYEAFAAISDSLNTPEEAEAVKGAYDNVDEQSIDYGIMEKSKKVSMVVAEFPWSDIGSWSALDEVMEQDADGNIIEGNVVGLECKDSIFFAGDKLVACIGLEGMMVVDTADATLIAPKDKAQRVKDMVALLKAQGKEEYLSPMIEDRPWGQFSVLGHGPSYKIKRIVVKPGARLSLQMHHHRSEHWIVVSGSARVTRGEDVFIVATNESTFIPATEKHCLENPGTIPLVIIEIQSGEYLGEDDIIRFDDVYGRDTEAV